VLQNDLETPSGLRLPGMVAVAAPSFSTLWRTSAAILQTFAAIPVALACWFLNTLVADAYVTVFQPSGLTLWTLAVAGWCGVFSAQKACAFLFPRYDERVVFVMFVFMSGFSPLLGYLSHVSGLEQVGRLAQMLATISTAYAVFLHPENNPFSETSAETKSTG
jgi:hypothetical protein